MINSFLKLIRNNNVVWSCLASIRIFSLVLSSWMKYGSKRQSAECIEVGNSRPKLPKMLPLASSGKVIASVFWNAQTILFICFFENENLSIPSYRGLVERLKTEIVKKRLQMKKRKVLFYQNNAQCHKSTKTTVKLNKLGFELLPSTLISGSSPQRLLPVPRSQKRMLTQKRYSLNEEVVDETVAYFGVIFVSEEKLLNASSVARSVTDLNVETRNRWLH